MRILLAGLGSAGQRHARNLRALLGSSVELLAYRVRRLPHVITPDLRIDSGDVEARYSIRTFTDFDEALGAKPDVVFVTNPTSLHLPVALAAARAGCHLFIEKPLSDTLTRVDELIDEIERRELVCAVGYQWRFHPAFALVRCRLQARAIGTLLAARLQFGEYLPGWHPYEDYRQMYASRRALGGGVVLAQIHDLDIAYAFFGRPLRIAAVGGHLTTLEVDVEDVASILMACGEGDHAFPVHLHQDYIRRPATRTCEIMGEAGTIGLDLQSGRVDVADADGCRVETHEFGHDRNQLFIDEVQHFLACVRGEADPVVGVREAAVSLRMARAVLDSMSLGRMVDFR